MSKQSEAKEAQGYTPKGRNCGNCIRFSSQFKEYPSAFGGTYQEEHSKRCTMGGFTVKKTAVCNFWATKAE